MKKTNTNPNAPQLAVLVRPIKADYHGSGIQSFTFDIVSYETSEAGSPRVRNISDSYNDLAPYANLEFRAQVSVTTLTEQPYGFDLEYRNVYSVDLRRAEHMVKILRKIRKAEEDAPVRPETMGQYVQMMALALGIKIAVQQRGPGTGWHDTTEYVIWKAKDLQFLVDGPIHEFLAQQRKVLAVTA